MQCLLIGEKRNNELFENNGLSPEKDLNVTTFLKNIMMQHGTFSILSYECS